MHIRRNDIVTPVSGSQASGGRTGKVLQVIRSKDRVVVEGVNLVKKHMRKSQDNPKGGIVEKEASLPVSSVMLFCPQCKKGVRIRRVVEGGKKIRACRKCRHPFDS